MQLEGKTAFVTGAGRGIGRAIALRFASEGCAIAAVARTVLEIEDTARAIRQHGGRAIALPCDVTRPEAVHAAVRTAEHDLGPIDILVNNAGGAPFRPFHEISLDEWKAAIDANLTSAFLCIQAVLPSMMQRPFRAHYQHVQRNRTQSHRPSERLLRGQTWTKRPDQIAGIGTERIRHRRPRHLPRRRRDAPFRRSHARTRQNRLARTRRHCAHRPLPRHPKPPRRHRHHHRKKIRQRTPGAIAGPMWVPCATRHSRPMFRMHYRYFSASRGFTSGTGIGPTGSGMSKSSEPGTMLSSEFHASSKETRFPV